MSNRQHLRSSSHVDTQCWSPSPTLISPQHPPTPSSPNFYVILCANPCSHHHLLENLNTTGVASPASFPLHTPLLFSLSSTLLPDTMGLIYELSKGISDDLNSSFTSLLHATYTPLVIIQCYQLSSGAIEYLWPDIL